MSKEDSIDVDDRNDFISVLGRIYFNYQRREQQSKLSNIESFKKLIEIKKHQNIILGDSRLLSLELSSFDNFSISGLTIASLLENVKDIFEKPVETLLISLGINDIKADYSLDEIKDNFSRLVSTGLRNSKKLIVTSIPYSLFRDNISNQDIRELNDYIYKLSKKLNIDFLDLNHLVSKNGMLYYKYTSDGLHFNSEGQEKINQFLKEKLSF